MERVTRGRARVKAEQHRGEQWLEQGELARAFAQLDRVRQSGKSGGFELKLLGDVLIAQGQLDLARERLDQYLARDWPPDRSERVVGMISRSRLELEAGHPERAEAEARSSVAICERTHNDSDLVTAEAVLARVLAAEHRFAEAKAAAEAALRLADRIEVAQEWIGAKLALAQARAALHPAELDAALGDVRTALDRALERGLLGQAYDAQLIAGEIAAQGGRAAAQAQLRALADDADRHGFGLIARKARAAAAPR